MLNSGVRTKMFAWHTQRTMADTAQRYFITPCPAVRLAAPDAKHALSVSINNPVLSKQQRQPHH